MEGGAGVLRAHTCSVAKMPSRSTHIGTASQELHLGWALVRLATSAGLIVWRVGPGTYLGNLTHGPPEKAGLRGTESVCAWCEKP